ncbi:hypothetical protein [Cesiribacter andamanensis]|nr:hypothetical protein [Cesiribacter andamanensis]
MRNRIGQGIYFFIQVHIRSNAMRVNGVFIQIHCPERGGKHQLKTADDLR